ncbi:hypothetical protein BDR04DRAFT_1104527 [Suillus decipiens]|nr:hypothetical protein BDR04DRAFT_1104527 [Suillus decipiens]
MPTAIYTLKSIARPSQYVSLTDDNIVGHSAEPGVMIEWFAKFHESVVTFQAVRNGRITDDYIYFDSDTRSLIRSSNPYSFLVKRSPKLHDYFFIKLEGSDLFWTLTSWDENSPIKIQRNTNPDSTEQLWKFEKVSDE